MSASAAFTPAVYDPVVHSEVSIYGVPAWKIVKQIRGYEGLNRQMKPFTKPPLKWIAIMDYPETIAFNERRCQHYREQLRAHGIELP